MRLREQETMDAEVARELDALDAAIAGKSVPEDPALADFVRELRAERPEPEQAFAAELDERAAAGFGRAKPASPFARLGDWATARPPRRLLAPAGAVLTLVVVVGAATMSQSDFFDGGSDRGEAPLAEPGGIATEIAPSQAPAPPTDTEAVEPSLAVPPGDSTAKQDTARQGLVPGQGDRKVEQSAQLTLSAQPEDVPDVADDVIAVSDRYSGIVVSSQVSGSGDDRSVARFDLAIPAAELQNALADLSELADVSARSESSLDITEPFVSAREQLADARAELDSLLTQLAEADTPAETASIRQRIDIVRSEIAAARGQLEDIARRNRFARVSVTVEGNGGGGGWSLGDAADDALDVLRTVAGVTLVSLAVLAPIALIAGLIWIVGRGLARRRRERALD